MNTDEPNHLSIETVIAGLDSNAAHEFARRCAERVRSLERASHFESALRHLRLLQEASSPGDDLSAGLLAARTAVALSYQEALGPEWDRTEPAFPAADEVSHALAAQDEMISAIWSDLAAVQGADAATAAVVGVLAPEWPDDTEASWYDLVATAERAARPLP